MHTISRLTRHPGKSPSHRSVHGEDYHTFGPPPLLPTETFETRLDRKAGGLTCEVHYRRGETDDHAWRSR